MSFSLVGVLAFAGAAASSPLHLSRPGFLPVQKHAPSSINVLPFQTPSSPDSAPRIKVTINPSSKASDVPTWWPVGTDVKVAVTPVVSSTTTTATPVATTSSTSVVKINAFVPGAATTSPTSSVEISALVSNLTSATTTPTVVVSPLTTDPAALVIAQPSTTFTISFKDNSTPSASSSASLTPVLAASSASAISSSADPLLSTSSSSSALVTPDVAPAAVTITSDTPYTFSDYSVSFHSASLSVDPTTTTTLSTTSTTTTTSTPTVSITYTVTGPSHPEATLAHSFKELAKEVRAFKEWSLNIDTDIDYFYKNGIQKSDLLYDYKKDIDALSANLTRTNRFLHSFRGIYNNTIHVLEDGFETLGSRIQDVSERFVVLESQTHTDIPPIYQKIEAVEAENTELREKLDELSGRESVSNDAVEERLGAIEAENAELREKLDQLLSQQVVPHDIVEEAPQPVEEYPEEQPEEEHVEAVIPEEPQPKEQYWPDWFEGEWNGED